jgi:hypothetical protein
MARYADEGGAEFLLTEMNTGITFAKLAVSARKTDSKKMERNRKNARKAYDSLLHFQDRVALSAQQAAALKAGKKQLQQLLRALGEAV